MCKWSSARNILIANKVVDFLAVISKNEETYFGFEATEGLAYIVGRDEDGAHSDLLQGRPGNVKKIIAVFESSLHGDGQFFGMGFGIYGRVLAIQSLSLSDANKPLLLDAIPLMIEVVQTSLDSPSAPLAMQFLLEMSFSDAALRLMENLAGFKDLLTTISTSSSDPAISKAASSILFKFAEDLRREQTQAAAAKALAASSSSSGGFLRKLSTAKAAPPAQPVGHVMISYCWAQQPLVKLLVPLLKAANIKVWFDLEQMKGDTVEAMAEAIEGSYLVLMCMSSAYKESANCRLEASYAHKSKKNVIPLLVEEGYSPTGWLGLLVGNALWYAAYTSDLVPTAATQVIPLSLSPGAVAPSGEVNKPVVVSTAAAAALPPKPVAKPASALDAFKLPDAVVRMTTEQVATWLTKTCGLAAFASKAKYAGANGRSLAIIWDMHEKGGPAVDVLVKLGATVVQALEVIYKLKELCAA